VDPDVTPMFFGFMSMGASGALSVVSFVAGIVFQRTQAFTR